MSALPKGCLPFCGKQAFGRDSVKRSSVQAMGGRFREEGEGWEKLGGDRQSRAQVRSDGFFWHRFKGRSGVWPSLNAGRQGCGPVPEGGVSAGPMTARAGPLLFGANKKRQGIALSLHVLPFFRGSSS
ncbi:hypothetical protein GCM10027398_21860 [Azotobacter salinestris]